MCNKIPSHDFYRMYDHDISEVNSPGRVVVMVCMDTAAGPKVGVIISIHGSTGNPTVHCTWLPCFFI